jgi:hypothetical protein
MEEYFFALVSPFIGAWILSKGTKDNIYWGAVYVMVFAVLVGAIAGQKYEQRKQADIFSKYCHGNEKTGSYRCQFPTDEAEENGGNNDSCGRACGE